MFFFKSIFRNLRMGDITVEKPVIIATEVTENIKSETNNVKKKGKNLLSLLRAIFKDPNYVRVEGGIQAYVLPRTDSHQVLKIITLMFIIF